MKVTELESGKAYQCVLSGYKMVVVETDRPEQTTKNEEGETVVVKEAEKVIAGKYCYEMDGIKRFQLDELVDGQLEELKN